MKKNILFISITVATLFASCGNGKEARECLNRAQTFYENKDFISAKIWIDTISVLYPKEIAIRKEALTLMRKTEIGESRQNIKYCDSMMPIREAELVDLKKGFVFEKDSAYDEIGNYIYNTMTIEKNVQRSYIRCGVNEEGEMYVASVYYGSKGLEHTGLKLSTNNGTYAETPAIPYDGGVNYRFKDMGATTEVVTYKGDNCKTVANFVCINDKEKIKVEYTGGKPYTLYLSEADKKAIKATYELASVLSDIDKMKKEKVKCEKRIARIEENIANSKF